jgi:SHS2 domain-containing protein
MGTGGHRILPHTADIIVEAWGDDIETCCEETVAAVMSSFLDASRAVSAGTHEVSLTADCDEDLVLGALDEILLLLDSTAEVPVSATVSRLDDTTFGVRIELAQRDSVEVTGAPPKGISLSGLDVERARGIVGCRLIVDV